MVGRTGETVEVSMDRGDGRTRGSVAGKHAPEDRSLEWAVRKTEESLGGVAKLSLRVPSSERRGLEGGTGRGSLR